MVFIAVMTVLKTNNIQMKSVAKFNKPDQVISVAPRHFPLAKTNKKIHTHTKKTTISLFP